MATTSRRAVDVFRVPGSTDIFVKPWASSQSTSIASLPSMNRHSSILGSTFSRILANQCSGAAASGFRGVAAVRSLPPLLSGVRSTGGFYFSGIRSRLFSTDSVYMALNSRLLRFRGYTYGESGYRVAGQSSCNVIKGRFFSTVRRELGFKNSANRSLGDVSGAKLLPLGYGVRGLGSFSRRVVKNRMFSSIGRNGRVGDMGKMGQKPMETVKSAAARYRAAVGLQIEAFWRRNYMLLVGAVAVVVCILLWRIMFGIASMFIGISEGMAKYGFLALASAIVAFTGLYLRSRFMINPDRVYRAAMTKLNTSAPVLEVMGAPLTGTDVRAYIMSGGGPKLKDFKLKLDRTRCFLIFPVKGSERRGLVSVEAKKKKGKYDLKLLAVDIPMASESDKRIFLIGDEQEYNVGGGLISELRDPIVKALAAEKEFDALDEKEEEEDKQREREEAERKQQEEEAEALRAEEERARVQLEQERAHAKEEERKRQESESQRTTTTSS